MNNCKYHYIVIAKTKCFISKMLSKFYREGFYLNLSCIFQEDKKRKEHEMLSSNLDSFESEISKKFYILYILFFIY